jgi:hypothetical protein
MFDLTEKSLENYLYENKNVLVKALKLPKGRYYNLFRQVNLFDYGIADIVLMDDLLRVYIIELKVKPLKAEDIQQLCKYRQAISKYSGFIVKCCYLLGEAPEKGGQGDYVYIAQNTTVIKYFQYEKSLKNGLKFEEIIPNEWKLSSVTDYAEMQKKIKSSLVSSIKKEQHNGQT